MEDPKSLSYYSEAAENTAKATTASEIASMYERGIIFRRWAATVIDLILLVAMAVAFFISFDMPDKNIFIKFAKTFCSMYFILFIAYYLVIEALTGYTLGKLILKIRVVDNDFNPPGFLKSLIRTSLRLIELNPLLFGGVPAGIIAATSKNKQRLGDIAAGTYVFEVSDIREDKRALHLSSAQKIGVVLVIGLISISLLLGVICLI
ncbi:MAG TPA: RDD family protein, partial [Clostridia bacterium]